jgi:ferredoxin
MTQSDIEERVIGGLTVRIDRLLCVGFGDCIDEAPDAFVFDDQGIITFTAAADQLQRERLLAACQICPVDALTVYENGTLIAPVRP